MAKRSIFDARTNLSAEQARSVVNSFMKKNKFKQKNYKGKQIFQKGVGFWTAARYIDVSYEDNGLVHISAWIKPFIIGSEQNLDGVVGIIPKRALKALVEKLVSELARQ